MKLNKNLILSVLLVVVAVLLTSYLMKQCNQKDTETTTNTISTKDIAKRQEIKLDSFKLKYDSANQKLKSFQAQNEENQKQLTFYKQKVKSLITTINQINDFTDKLDIFDSSVRKSVRHNYNDSIQNQRTIDSMNAELYIATDKLIDYCDTTINNLTAQLTVTNDKLLTKENENKYLINVNDTLIKNNLINEKTITGLKEDLKKANRKDRTKTTLFLAAILAGLLKIISK